MSRLGHGDSPSRREATELRASEAAPERVPPTGGARWDAFLFGAREPEVSLPTSSAAQPSEPQETMTNKRPGTGHTDTVPLQQSSTDPIFRRRRRTASPLSTSRARLALT